VVPEVTTTALSFRSGKSLIGPPFFTSRRDSFRTLESGRAVAFMMDDALLAGERAKAKKPDNWERFFGGIGFLNHLSNHFAASPEVWAWATVSSTNALLESGRAVAFMMDDALLAGERAKAKKPDNWEIVGTAQSHIHFFLIVQLMQQDLRGGPGGDDDRFILQVREIWPL
jgi:ABC-type amino acid transport substrate-binding protein